MNGAGSTRWRIALISAVIVLLIVGAWLTLTSDSAPPHRHARRNSSATNPDDSSPSATISISTTGSAATPSPGRLAVADNGGAAPRSKNTPTENSPTGAFFVRGSVLEVDGSVVSGATVEARHQGAALAAVTTSDTGTFALSVDQTEIELVATRHDLAHATTRQLHAADFSERHTAQVQLVLPAGTRVTGSIHDSAGQPIADASVDFYVLSENGQLHGRTKRVISNAAGMVSAVLDAGSFLVVLLAEEPGEGERFLPTEQPLDVHGDEVKFEITVTRPGVIELRFRSAEVTMPTQGAFELWIDRESQYAGTSFPHLATWWKCQPTEDRWQRLKDDEVVKGKMEVGSRIAELLSLELHEAYRIGGLPKGTYELRMAVNGPFKAVVIHAEVLPGAVTPVTLELVRGRQISGHVSDATGAAWSEMVMVARRLTDDHEVPPDADTVPETTTHSDNLGDFVFDGLEPGVYRVMAIQSDRARPSQDVDVRAADGQLTFVLKPATLLFGKVTSAEGHPLRCVVTAYAANLQRLTELGRAETNSAGHFRIADLPLGAAVRLKANIWSQDLMVPDREFSLDAAQLKVNLTAVALANLKGRVTDAAGQPVTLGEVQLRRLDGSWMYDVGVAPDRTAFFREQVLPGKYLLQLALKSAKHGEAALIVPVELRPAETLDQPITVPNVFEISGRVVGPTGEPCDVSVGIEPTDLHGVDLVRVATENGRFKLPAVAAGRYFVVVRRANIDATELLRQPLQLDTAVSDLDLHVAVEWRVVKLVARVVDAGGKPVAGLQLGDATPDPKSGSAFSGSVTGTNGEWMVKNFPIGRYTLRGINEVGELVEPDLVVEVPADAKSNSTVEVTLQVKQWRRGLRIIELLVRSDLSDAVRNNVEKLHVGDVIVECMDQPVRSTETLQEALEAHDRVPDTADNPRPPIVLRVRRDGVLLTISLPGLQANTCSRRLIFSNTA